MCVCVCVCVCKLVGNQVVQYFQKDWRRTGTYIKEASVAGKYVVISETLHYTLMSPIRSLFAHPLSSMLISRSKPNPPIK
jgi:hypothetical protein